MTSTDSLPIRTILVLAANPKGTASLRLEQEVRDIDESLKRSKYRNNFVLEQRWAVRPEDVQHAMLEVNPQIVHFSGHGGGDEGLILEDDSGNPQWVGSEALSGLFQLVEGSVECVVLNACYSEIQAKLIVQHVPYLIGMSCAIGDRAALKFSCGFYDALGAGYEIEFAYKWGCSSIRMAGIYEHLTPVLTKGVSQVGSTKKISSQPNTLSTWERQQFEKDQASLQQEYEILGERIQRLNNALAIETDVTVRFKYEQVIQQDQLKRDCIIQKIEDIDSRLQSR
ncbi:CHAT domain-containing protein [Oculatella sp. FACHB-28]|uniref:CHAT domain-containing protein n=1 Tax=Oculatella sp. FACHB-28 TaxID=2692845 RepID=UPI0016840365|nr:CHAT domain-containing protein [Oculatella sp. FACHB-28]MBD2056566.1 CHAT domain-containing protein [Oculatella sp. FACHB-28]